MDLATVFGDFLRRVIVGALVILLGTLAFVRYKQLPYYRKLMAFPRFGFEGVPLLSTVIVHVSMLWAEYRTGVQYRVHYLKTSLKRIEQLRREGCFALFIGIAPTMVLFRADLIEKLLTSSTNIEKGHSYKVLHPWLGTGLLTSTGAKWKQRRKLLTPAFHFRILDKFTHAMNRQTKLFLERLVQKEDDEDIVPYIAALTLDIVCETAMGIRMNSQTTGRGREYLESLKSLVERLSDSLLFPTQWVECIYQMTQAYRDNACHLKRVHNFTMEVINRRKEELEAELRKVDENSVELDDETVRPPKPFLDMLLIQHLKHGTLSLEDIREEVDTFMFAGHDTTSMGLTMAVYLFGRNRGVQKRIQEEIDVVFQGDTEADVTVEHIKQMTYLDRALKESQRILPSVPMIIRTVTEEFELEGRPVPVDTEVYCHVLGLHRDPNVFPDPLKFDPDRFLPENSVGRSPFAFIPFSAGPRNCVGQKFAYLEEKIILIHLLRKFTLESLDPLEDIDLVAEIVLVPKTPIRVKFIPRSKESNGSVARPKIELGSLSSSSSSDMSAKSDQ